MRNGRLPSMVIRASPLERFTLVPFMVLQFTLAAARFLLILLQARRVPAGQQEGLILLPKQIKDLQKKEVMSRLFDMVRITANLRYKDKGVWTGSRKHPISSLVRVG